MAAEKKKQVKKWEARKYCPKCGTGVRLAEHDKRRSCGKCGYAEMK
jgi:small subunit ribosomal protein S27Ae